MSTYVSVEISPATTTSPVVISVSQATRPAGSSTRTASRIASETWSATLSGWPSVTDSDVKRNSRSLIRAGRYLLDPEEPRHRELAPVLRAVQEQAAEGRRVVLDGLRHGTAGRLHVVEGVLEDLLRVGVDEPTRLAGDSR